MLDDAYIDVVTFSKSGHAFCSYVASKWRWWSSISFWSKFSRSKETHALEPAEPLTAQPASEWFELKWLQVLLLLFNISNFNKYTGISLYIYISIQKNIKIYVIYKHIYIYKYTKIYNIYIYQKRTISSLNSTHMLNDTDFIL